MGDMFDFQGIVNHGLYWHRSKVNWWPGAGGQIRLLGRTWRTARQFDENDLRDTVDFSKQRGIYLLHQGQEVMYVGQTVTRALGGGLFARLRLHHNDRTKSPLWDRFSWFGFRPVKSGQLQDIPISGNQHVRMRRMVRMIEAVLIETYKPKLNRQVGRLGTNYGQVTDPSAPLPTHVQGIYEQLNKIIDRLQ